MKGWASWITLAIGFVIGWWTLMVVTQRQGPSVPPKKIPETLREVPEKPIPEGPWSEIYPWDEPVKLEDPDPVAPPPAVDKLGIPNYLIAPESPLAERRNEEPSQSDTVIPPQQQQQQPGQIVSEPGREQGQRPQQPQSRPSSTGAQSQGQQNGNSGPLDFPVSEPEVVQPPLTTETPALQAPDLTPPAINQLDTSAPRLIEPESPKQYQLPQGQYSLPAAPSAQPPSTFLPKLTPEEIGRLMAKQTRYLSLGWRKFITYNRAATLWVPGQLFYYLFNDEAGTELYHCEAQGVLYGMQVQPFAASLHPVGTTETRTLLIRASKEWISQYVADDPTLRVFIQQYYPGDRNSKGSLDVTIFGPNGQTRLRILLSKNAIISLWTAFRSERSMQERFTLFVDGLEVL